MTFGVLGEDAELARATASRWSSYALEFNVLRPDGDEIGRYRPMDYPSLLVEIAKLNDGNRSQAERFTQTWGLLTPTKSFVPIAGDTVGGNSGNGLKESLPWLWTHARALRIALELAYLLEHSDEDGVANFIRSLPGAERLYTTSELFPDTPGSPQEIPQLTIGTPSGTSQIELRSRGTPSQTAGWYIEHLVNTNARHGWERIQFSGKDKTFGVALDLDAPIVAAYVHLRDALASKTFKRCLGCGNVFPQRRVGQEFCPAPPPWKTKGGESTCGARLRKRRQPRRKQAAK